ncbi:hypothetical protein T07_15236 [Trichinella nelsoni]|uniref:Uncharacterized protein n=1 Tax=Trichinella nelsoni TaxID=6336 RepID=A0A0V0SFY1_9BILA|nr:hypothetical protein T07_15236 [Trichinella nelsoni]
MDYLRKVHGTHYFVLPKRFENCNSTSFDINPFECRATDRNLNLITRLISSGIKRASICKI